MNLLRSCIFAFGAVLFAAASAVRAQPELSPSLDQTPTRVLQLSRVEGAASLQRSGRTVELQPGFLVFSEERVMLAPGARADLQLTRHGEIALGSGKREAALAFEKLPFSSWAVDLETRLRLEGGELRVRWARPGDASEWPLTVALGDWNAQLGNGEYLFRRDDAGMQVCVLSGRLELLAAGQPRVVPEVGQCIALRGRTAEPIGLAAEDWNALQVVIAPQFASELSESRSLRIPSPPPSAEERAVAAPPADAVAAASETAAAPPAPAPSAPAPSAPAPAAVDVAAAPAESPPVNSPPPDVSPAPAAASESVSDAMPNVAPAASVEPEKAAIPAPQAEAAAATVVAVPALPPAIATPTAPAAPAVPPASAPPPAAAPAPAASTSAPAAGSAPVATAASVTVDAATFAGPEWIVNVMTVTDPEVANRHLKVLNDAGYPAVLRQETVRGRGSYRIIIGGIANEDGARRVADLLVSKMGYAAAWPLQKR